MTGGIEGSAHDAHLCPWGGDPTEPNWAKMMKQPEIHGTTSFVQKR